MVIDVCVEKSIKKSLIRHGINVRFIGCTLLIGLIVFGSRSTAICATKQDLQNEIAALSLAVDRDISQDIEVINAILMVIAPPQSLTLGTVEGTKGKTVNVPIYLKASTAPVSGIQFDVSNVTGLSVTDAVPGLAAQASGKSVTGNQTMGAFRVIVFGLNQTAIPSGPVVVLKVNIGSTIASGKKPISLSNVTGTSPSGSNVVLTGRAGSLSVK